VTTDISPPVIAARGQWNVTGHDRAVEALGSSLERPAHAYLFTGPKRTGKRTLAVELAKALNCEAALNERPCQTCSACRLIDKWGHPDVTLIQPEEKAHIVIEQVRQIRQELALRPNQGRWRVVIVRADLLTENAADALLKTLEEPNPQVILILTTYDVEAVPETIVSRCRSVTLGLVSTEQVEAELRRRGIDRESASSLAALSYGAVGWAVEAASDDALVKNRTALHEDMARWRSDSLRERLSAAEWLSSGGKPDKSRTQSVEELEIMLTWWRDIMLAASGNMELVVNAAWKSEIEAAAARESPATALRVIRLIVTAITRINQNVDPRLSLEALAVGL
jgi:DNA polymerase-3 subunit delta'